MDCLYRPLNPGDDVVIIDPDWDRLQHGTVVVTMGDGWESKISYFDKIVILPRHKICKVDLSERRQERFVESRRTTVAACHIH